MTIADFLFLSHGGVERTNLINRLISYGRGFVPLPNLFK